MGVEGLVGFGCGDPRPLPGLSGPGVCFPLLSPQPRRHEHSWCEFSTAAFGGCSVGLQGGKAEISPGAVGDPPAVCIFVTRFKLFYVRNERS